MTQEDRELITIEEHDEFISKLNQASLTVDEKVKLIQGRWDYLYEKYRPNDKHISARRSMK